ncbi:hypothetical protein ACRBEV_32900 (plasmid) [Methylobacterium phyllosphaerae]
MNVCDTPEAAGDKLLRLAQRWLACREAIAALLDVEKPAVSESLTAGPVAATGGR